MKSILTILRLLKQQRAEALELYPDDHRGLCLELIRLYERGLISSQEGKKWDEWFQAQFIDQLVYFTQCGEETANWNQFVWPLSHQEVRTKWIDKQIAFEEKEIWGEDKDE